MTSPPKGRLLLAAGAMFAVATWGFTSRPPEFVLINESPSLPKGLYVRSGGPLARGAIVAVRQPRVARTYLAGLGMPADVRLIKRVAATAGDQVCAVEGAVSLPARAFPVQDRDRLGTKLPIWRGCRNLRSDELFLLGETHNSFDSRYFGPVSLAQVDGVFRQVMSW